MPNWQILSRDDPEDVQVNGVSAKKMLWQQTYVSSVAASGRQLTSEEPHPFD
ncbi:MAG: hypothetical protein LC799_01825 [Actinobacteria bacterium]|nr:hypothetical protein [Actinomycetota bacterium]